MLRLRSRFWVVLVCICSASGLLVPQQAQAWCWGCHTWCGSGCYGWGGYRPIGGGICECGYGAGWAPYWGGSCYGGSGGCGRQRCYSMRCNSGCNGVYGSTGGYGYGASGGYGYGYGGGNGNPVGGGYATGTYTGPSYDPNTRPAYSPQPSGTLPPSGVTTPPSGVTTPPPVPAAPDAAPTPGTDATPTPKPGTSTQLQRNPGRALALQSFELDVSKDATGIVVYVPEEAIVFVNGQQMKTKGTERHFSADQLLPGQVYNYDIRAEMVRNGAKLVREDKVGLKAGRLEEIAFDFSDTVAPIELTSGRFKQTRLTVVVPEDASVYLAGEDTISVGKVRKFVTAEIANGQAWKDYEVRVEVERNGKTVIQKKTISLVAGDDQELVFEFDANKKLASTNSR